ncbi:unnamed protein product [Lactuca virosa]|uniref:Uncharacterized protein n=1 Tax=Lactuca virosa TaxID=75947 RepID=A0AAU9LV12_9ASTR|nr:unnamed protein product [Lactuca virosa]
MLFLFALISFPRSSSLPINNKRKMSPFPLKGAPTRPRKNMHRLLQRHLNETSTPAATVTSPLVTPTSTPTTVSTPSTTPAQSSSPTSTTILSTPVSSEQQDIQLEGHVHVKVRENTLLPSNTCSSIIKKSFLDKVDENGYKWVTISEEIKQFYWEEFQKKCQWDVAVGDSEEYTGQAPSCYDVFMFTHTKDHDGKTFQVDKAKEVHEYFVSQRADLALLGEEVDESELFYKAVRGHDRKKRIYGLGSYGRSIFPENSSQTCTSPETTSQKHHLETKIQKLEETIEQQRTKLNVVRNMVNDMRNTNNQ